MRERRAPLFGLAGGLFYMWSKMCRCIWAAIRSRIVDAVRTVPQLTMYNYGRMLLFCFCTLVSFDPFSPFRFGVWCRLGWTRRHPYFVVTPSLPWPVFFSLSSKTCCTPRRAAFAVTSWAKTFRAFECDLPTGLSDGGGRGRPGPARVHAGTILIGTTNGHAEF